MALPNCQGVQYLDGSLCIQEWFIDRFFLILLIRHHFVNSAVVTECQWMAWCRSQSQKSFQAPPYQPPLSNAVILLLSVCRLFKFSGRAVEASMELSLARETKSNPRAFYAYACSKTTVKEEVMSLKREDDRLTTFLREVCELWTKSLKKYPPKGASPLPPPHTPPPLQKYSRREAPSPWHVGDQRGKDTRGTENSFSPRPWRGAPYPAERLCM